MRPATIQVISVLILLGGFLKGELTPQEDRAYISFGLIQHENPRLLHACVAIRKDAVPANALLEAELRSEGGGEVILTCELFKPDLPSDLFGRRYVEVGITVEAGTKPTSKQPNPSIDGVENATTVKYLSEGRFYVAFFLKDCNERRRVGILHFGLIGTHSKLGEGFYILGGG
jgi:hypothetical protein